MGILFTATAVVVQTVLPATQLGAGFGAVRYLGQIGGVLGIALVGTVVNVSLAAELQHQLPVSVTTRLASDGVRLTASPQVLVSPSFQRNAVQSVADAAAARVPSGRHHATRLAAAVAREMALLNKVFAALRLSLALAIRHGLVTALLFCVGALPATLAMKHASTNSEQPLT